MSMSVHYTSFQQVFRDVISGIIRNEAELKQAFVEALKSELQRLCNKYIVDNMLIPALEETLRKGRPDIRLSNLVIEVEPPQSGLEKGREQLKRYMEELYELTRGRVEVHGLVTDGVSAEAYMLDSKGLYCRFSGDMPSVAGKLISTFCSLKIPIINLEDLIRLFGV